MNGKWATAVAALAVAGVSTLVAPAAQAHGYVTGPYSRAMACKLGLNVNCGGVVYEPQSLEAPKGFPAAGPTDGRIASAGGAFPELDQQSAGRWYKNVISTGQLRMDWTYTAPHRTAQWSYYMTKQGWNANAPLKRSDLELIASVAHDGSAANSRPGHSITIPANRDGYHVILAVWEISDTANAFYNVIDVTVNGTSSGTEPTPPTTPTSVPTVPAQRSDTEAPSAPRGMHTMAVSATSVELMWTPSRDNVGVTSYVVLRDGQVVGRTAAAQFTDRLPDASSTTASFQYQVVATDAAGNVSARSTAMPVEMTSPATGQPGWNAMSRYRKGDLVTYRGATYRCIQGYQGYGDPNWILAPSLWKRVA